MALITKQALTSVQRPQTVSMSSSDDIPTSQSSSSSSIPTSQSSSSSSMCEEASRYSSIRVDVVKAPGFVVLTRADLRAVAVDDDTMA
eukprot:12085202-Karenia_brevis.AAC.1